MAFVKSYGSEQGFTAPTAYFRIVDLKANWQVKKANITVAIYKDEAARTAEKEPMGYQTHRVGPHDVDEIGTTFDELFSVEVLGELDNNPVRSAYNWLMTRSENSGAVAV